MGYVFIIYSVVNGHSPKINTQYRRSFSSGILLVRLVDPGKIMYVITIMWYVTAYLYATMAYWTVGLTVFVIIRVAVDDLPSSVVGQGGVVHAGVYVCHFWTT